MSTISRSVRKASFEEKVGGCECVLIVEAILLSPFPGFAASEWAVRWSVLGQQDFSGPATYVWAQMICGRIVSVWTNIFIAFNRESYCSLTRVVFSLGSLGLKFLLPPHM